MRGFSRRLAHSILFLGVTLPQIGAAEVNALPVPLPTLNLANTAWMLTATVLVLFMTLPGLALFYGGLVRAKNVLSVLMQCFAITCGVTLLWILFAYSLTFRDGGVLQPFLGGWDRLFLLGMGADTLKGDIPESVFSMFQLTFAIITPALIVGGFAERMRFPAMISFCLLWLLICYVPVAHWVWGDGWLQKLGVLDFAGGIVVHVNAGTAALVAALVIGRRRGFPQTAMQPHNMTMTVTGAGMLWVGWFGFNAGSALAANGSAGMTMLTTHISAAAGAWVWMTIEWIKYGKPSALGVVTGMVAGLGTITPASGYVGPLGALLIGCLAGSVCFYATHFMKRKLNVDDSLDVFPVHGVGGIMGSTLTGVFCTKELGGMLEPMSQAMPHSIGEQVLIQLLAVGATFAWSGFWTFVLLKGLERVLVLRSTPEEEHDGLDLTEHNEAGYNI
jgi:Amt family ammonium transporter